MTQLIPRLRFPEFKDSPPWVVKKLGDIAPLQRGFDLPTSKIEPGEYPVIYSNGHGGWHNKAMAKAPGVLTGRSGTIGNVHYIENGEYWPHNTTLWVTDFCGNYPQFIYWLYTNVDLSHLATGSGVPTLNRNVVHAVKLPLPTPAEQEKIAACLGSLDSLIAAETQRLEHLETHKKGLMQALFPAEGELVPRLRFPEFKDSGPWEVKPFNHFVAESFYGISKSTAETGCYPVLRMGNMADGLINIDDLVYIDLPPAEYERYALKKGDILLNRTNSADLVGKVSLFDLPGEYISASYLVTYRLKPTRIIPEFCNYLLNTPDKQNQIRLLSTRAVSQANINPTTFRTQLSIAVPTLPEQEKIAAALGSLDTLIAAQKDRLNQLNDHKQGLMQRLFPALEN